MAGPSEIQLVDLTKRFGPTVAVDGISLTVPDGTYCCLLGPSGCGKTTTLRVIAGHEVPTSGDVRIGGESVIGLSPKRRGTAMMFQDYALFPHRTCLDNVAFNLKMRGVDKAERRRRARDMLAQFRMEEFAERYPAQLSAGQKQRIALARAVITRPRVLLLDEPLSQLDEFLRVQVRNDLRQIQRELGITFVHVTHSQLEAMAVADLLVVMDNGHIVQAGAAHNVYMVPRNAYIARFMGGHNILAGRMSGFDEGAATLAGENGERYVIPAADRPATTGDPVFFSIRRDSIAVHKKDGVAEIAPNSVRGTVRSVQYQGTYVRVTLSGVTDEDFIATISSEAFEAAPVAEGDDVMASWETEAIHLLAGETGALDEMARERMKGQ